MLQIEEARKNEGERTGKAHEDMARAKAELKRLEKELASLQVLPLTCACHYSLSCASDPFSVCSFLLSISEALRVS